jgi:hypothetical protein
MEEAISKAIEIEKQKMVLREKKKDQLKYSKSPSKPATFISKIDNLPKNVSNNVESMKILTSDTKDMIFLHDKQFDNLFANENQTKTILQSSTIDRKKGIPLFKRMEQEGKQRLIFLEKEKVNIFIYMNLFYYLNIYFIYIYVAITIFKG